jgi:hypothetical protein
MDMGLFYPKVSKLELVGAGYFSDPYNGRSQTGYLFTSGGTTISRRSVKQTITATSSNHAELFIKSLPNRVFEKLVKKIGLRRLIDNCLEEGKKSIYFIILTK